MLAKAYFFDFDGTLADTTEGIISTMEHTFKEMHLPVPSSIEMRHTIGLPLSQALQMLGHLSDSDTAIATETYRRLFHVYESRLIKIFPQVGDTLTALRARGCQTAIVTSRDASSLTSILQANGMSDLFDAIVSHADGLAPKPSPQMVEMLLRRMNLQAHDVVVVGDTTFDIEMGNSAGCHTVAVTYGNHNRAKLESASPDYFIDKFCDILELDASSREE